MQITVQQQIREMLGYFWFKMFLDSDFVNAWVSSIATPFDDLNRYVANLPNYVSRYKILIQELSTLRLFVIDESKEDLNANRYGDAALFYGGAAIYGQQTVTSDNRRFPFDTTYAPQYLSTSIDNPQSILRLGQDYVFEDGWIIFLRDPESLVGIQKKAKAGTDGQTYFEMLLWGVQVLEDLQAICNFFGTMAAVCGPSTERTMEAINVAWDLRVTGATVRNVQRLCAVITGVDYVYEEGIVKDIYQEGDSVCVLADNAVYTAPLEAKVLATVGQTLQPDDVIFDTFVIKSSNDSIDFDDFEGLTLGGGHLPSLGGSLFFPNSREDIDKVHNPGWYTVRSQ